MRRDEKKEGEIGMSWFGGAIGYVLGSRFGALGGILGAVLGSGIADLLKSKANEADVQRRMEQDARERMRSRAASRNGSTTEREVVFLSAVGAMLAKLSKADGHVDASEIEAGEQAFVRLGLTPANRKLCIRAFHAAKTDAHSIFDYAESFASVARAVAIREMMYDILWDVACADGTVSVEERRILEMIVTPLRIRPSLFSEQWSRRIRASRPAQSAIDPYAVLGCSASATNEEVRRAYRAQAKKHHPDILRAQGLPEEMIARANEQMARINAAWDEIKRARGLG